MARDWKGTQMSINNEAEKKKCGIFTELNFTQQLKRTMVGACTNMDGSQMHKNIYIHICISLQSICATFQDQEKLLMAVEVRVVREVWVSRYWLGRSIWKHCRVTDMFYFSTWMVVTGTCACVENSLSYRHLGMAHICVLLYVF